MALISYHKIKLMKSDLEITLEDFPGFAECNLMHDKLAW